MHTYQHNGHCNNQRLSGTQYLGYLPRYQGWEPLWTTAWAIPAGIENRVGYIDPAMHSKLISAANQCAKLATKTLGIRNENNEQWIDSMPSLRERKIEAIAWLAL